jgi:hypothetical protein
MAPLALFNGYRRSSPMTQQHCHFDASRSLTTLEQDNTIVAVIEMSQSKRLIAGQPATGGTRCSMEGGSLRVVARAAPVL